MTVDEANHSTRGSVSDLLHQAAVLKLWGTENHEECLRSHGPPSRHCPFTQISDSVSLGGAREHAGLTNTQVIPMIPDLSTCENSRSSKLCSQALQVRVTRVCVCARVCVCVCVCAHSCSVVPDSATPWTVARQPSLSMNFSRPEYWSGLPFPIQGIFSTLGSNSHLLQFDTSWGVSKSPMPRLQIKSLSVGPEHR